MGSVIEPAASCQKQYRLLSVVGTYLKPEMQTIYRQVNGLAGIDHTIATERAINLERFPFPNIATIDKMRGGRSFGRMAKPEKLPSSSFAGLVLSTLQNAGYKVKVAAVRMLRKLRWKDYHLVDLLNVEALKPLSHHQSTFDLIKVVGAIKPDLIHVYFGNKATGYYWQLKKLNVPWVVSFHGVDIAKNMGDPEYRAEFRAMCDSATLILARSEELLSELQAIGCPRDKLRINRTSLPLRNIQSQIRTVPENGRWRIMQACRLIPKKGLITSLEAFALVLKEFPRAEFLICGTGSMEKTLKDKVKALGVSDSVKLMGHVDIERLFELHMQSHIFLHPSEVTIDGDREGIPNSLLEAVATGMPFVSTYHGGIPEVLSDGQGGRLVPEKSAQDVYKALKSLIIDKQFYERCSSQARAQIEKEFDLEYNAERLKSIYHEAISLQSQKC